MQRIATIVRLNRSVLQFDDAAHARLEQYLAESASLLEGDPDPQEILADLEQAVADQCARRLRPGHDVVTLDELAPALDEIGTVQIPGNGAYAASVPPPPPAAWPNSLRSLQQVLMLLQLQTILIFWLVELLLLNMIMDFMELTS